MMSLIVERSKLEPKKTFIGGFLQGLFVSVKHFNLPSLDKTMHA